MYQLEAPSRDSAYLRHCVRAVCVWLVAAESPTNRRSVAHGVIGEFTAPTTVPPYRAMSFTHEKPTLVACPACRVVMREEPSEGCTLCAGAGLVEGIVAVEWRARNAGLESATKNPST